MDKKMIILLYVCSILLMMGCQDEQIVEELGLIHTVGYDRAESRAHEEELLLVTVSYPLYHKEGLSRQTISSTAETSKEARILLSRQTDKHLVSGQLRSVLIGKELANEGFWDVIDTLKRDSSLGTRVKISIVDGRAHDLLTKKYPYFPELDNAIDSLLDKESKLNTIPEINLQRFVKDLLDDGVDPIAPIISIGEAGMITDGVALLRNDQYITNLDPFQSRILFLMLGDFKQGDLSIKLDNQKALFSTLTNKRKIIVNTENRKKIDVSLDIKFGGYLLEYQGDKDLFKEVEIHKLEKEIAAYITNEVDSIISIMQEHKIDNLGIGQYIRNDLPFEDWKNLNWPESISTIEIHPKITVNILDIGLFSK